MGIVRVMRIVFYGQSAFSYWLTASSCAPPEARVGMRFLKDCEPTPDAISYLEQMFPRIPQPYHVLVDKRTKKRLREAALHLCVYRPAARSFCRIAAGVLVSSPELCLVQLARAFNFAELLFAANILCGIFYKSAHDGSLQKRSSLTSKRKIGTFLGNNPGIPGSEAVRRVLPYVTEGVASPPEAVIAMMLGLPFRLGGFQLDEFQMNCRITPSLKARAIAGRATLVPDVLFADARLALEYDSTAEHTSGNQLARDSKKRLALEADGYKVITVTAGQLRSAADMQLVAREVYRHLGRRFRPRSGSFDRRQREVVQSVSVIDRLFCDLG